MSVHAVPFQRSIRFRLSLVLAAVIFVAVIAASAVNGWRDLHQSADARAELLEAAASSYAANLDEPLINNDARGAYTRLRGLREFSGFLHAAVRDADGVVFAQLGGGVALRGRDRDLRDLSGLELLSANSATISQDVMSGGARIGQIVILADISDLRSDVLASLLWTAAIALAAIVGGVVVAQAMIERLTRPLRQLTAVMAEIGSAQDFSRRMPPTSRTDESAVLGEAFNGMIDNIRERDQRIARHLETLEATVDERTHDLRLAKEDAESANAAKSDFLATMSHEIRTPMNGMMVMAEMLAAADLSARHRRYAEIISRSGASLLTIINDILDLSKIEAGKMDLESVAFSPDALVEDVAALFWERARSKGLELAVYIAPETPHLVIGDPTRFNQVITNLVNNALKFTETGGVTVSVTAASAGNRARIKVAVADTGVGIPKDRIGSIFEAFSQADQSTTRKFGGTGLGLTVCKRLVDAMAGAIRVESEIGQGSTFSVIVDLPIEEAAPPAPQAADLRMAIAVNSNLMARCLSRALRDVGAGVRRIASPDEAEPGEIVLADSDLLATQPAASGVVAVCLSDVGDSRADQLLRQGAAADLLSLPVGRRALWDFVVRANSQSWRGVSALGGSGGMLTRESFAALRVLAVDDNAVNREVLREALLTLDVSPDFASNGEEAVAAAEAQRYDAIFMDGSMPVMDGFTATSLIRSHESKSGRTPARIIALTAQVRGADADAWNAAGADQHMTKPFTAARLVDALKLAEARLSPASYAGEVLDPTLPSSSVLRPGVLDHKSGETVDFIDEEALATMEGVAARSGRDLVGKIWKLFAGQAPLGVTRIESIVASTPIDAAELSRQAHALKSMCLSSGAGRLAALCETIEAEAKSGQIEAAASNVDRLAPLLTETGASNVDRLAPLLTETGRHMQSRLASRAPPSVVAR